jgi:hypothetical protein
VVEWEHSSSSTAARKPTRSVVPAAGGYPVWISMAEASGDSTNVRLRSHAVPTWTWNAGRARGEQALATVPNRPRGSSLTSGNWHSVVPRFRQSPLPRVVAAALHTMVRTVVSSISTGLRSPCNADVPHPQPAHARLKERVQSASRSSAMQDLRDDFEDDLDHFTQTLRWFDAVSFVLTISLLSMLLWLM